MDRTSWDPDWWPAGYGQLQALWANGYRQAQTVGYLEPDWTSHPFLKEESPGLEL